MEQGLRSDRFVEKKRKQMNMVHKLIDSILRIQMLQNIRRRPPTNVTTTKLKREDYQKIKLPRCSSLYSQFHYKIGNEELEKMVFGKHKLVISNLEALRAKDTLYIKQLKAEISKLEEKVLESNQKLKQYEQKMKGFFFKKLKNMGEYLTSIAKETDAQQEHQEQINSFVKKNLEKISGLMKNFGILEIDEIIKFVVSEELKKPMIADSISQKLQKTQLVLSALNSSQKQLQLEKMASDQQKIMLKNKELEQKLSKKLQQQKIQQQIEEKYIGQLNDATRQFRLEMKHSKIEQFTKQELITNQQSSQMDKKSLTILYKEKLSFVFHLFKKFEFQYLERFNELTDKISGLEQQLKTQDYFISKQTRTIRQLQKNRSASMQKPDQTKENENEQCKRSSGKSISWVNNARSNKTIKIFDAHSKSKHKIKL